MEAAAQPEHLNQEGFDAFRQRTDEEGPVVMLNLLRFRPDGGQQRYAEYADAVAPCLEKVGGRIVFAGQPAAPLLGDEGWDLVAVVEYPSRQAFLRHDRLARVHGDRPPANRGAGAGRAAPDGPGADLAGKVRQRRRARAKIAAIGPSRSQREERRLSVDLLKWKGAARARTVVLVLAVGLAGAAWAGCGSNESTDTINSIQEELEEKADEAQQEIEKGGEKAKEGLKKGSEELKQGLKEGGETTKQGVKKAKEEAEKAIEEGAEQAEQGIEKAKKQAEKGLEEAKNP